MLEDLFPTSFVRSIQHLRIVARHRVAGLDRGEHTARRAGAGLDFRDYRPYAPGDDLRRVDWNVYRRSRRLSTRVFDEVERLAVYVLLDASASMFFESPARADAARQMTAAIAAAAMRQHDRVMVFPFGARLGDPIRLPAKQGLPRLLNALVDLAPAGPTDFERVVQDFERLRLPAGLVAIVSDFFDHHGMERAATAIGRLRHRRALVQIVRPTDRDPGIAGNLRILDCENGDPVEIGADAETRAAYRVAYDRFQTELETFAMRHQAALVRVDAEQPVLDQLHLLFAGGILHL